MDRKIGQKGYCQAGNTAKVALVSIHKWEEPCISGENGAGTVFFSHCNLSCEFCQNHAISAAGYGIDVSEDRLTEIFLQQQSRGVECLELVSPTHYADIIVRALAKAKKNNLSIPVVYNCNGYQSVEEIASLEGYVDVFLPDLKYYDDEYAVKYSHALGYFTAASKAIKKMFEITGPVVMDNNMLKKGVLVRHLILPWLYKDSIKIMQWLRDNFADDIYISLMNQYIPAHNAINIPKLNRKLTTFEYQKVIDAALAMGIKNCFVQEKSSASIEFIPDFNGANVL